MLRSLVLASRSAFLLALVSAPARAGVATILGQPTTYATIQAAVDAAIDGDVVLVQPGTYAGFTIDAKAVSVFGLPGSSVNVNTQVKIQNVNASRTVILSGLKVTAEGVSSSTVPGRPGLVLTSDTGHVRLQGCTFKGGTVGVASYPADPFPAGHGVQATGCTRVVFTQCTLRGSDVGFVAGEAWRPGGDGLNGTSSTIALYDCTVKGGIGSHESWPTGGTGGAGCVMNSLGLVASGSTITGGQGGGGDYIGCSTSGDGGPGLVLNEAQAQILDTPTIAGAEGSYYTCSPGNPGQAIVSDDGVLNPHSGTRRKLTGPALTTDNAAAAFVVTGEPGDKFWLVRSYKPLFRDLGALNGVAAVAMPWMFTVTPMGVIDGSGTATVTLYLGEIPGSQTGWTWFLQGFCTATTGDKYLTSPLQLLITDN